MAVTPKEEDSESLSFSAHIPRPIIALIGGAFTAIGITVGAVLSPKVEEGTVQACFGNAERAIDLATTALDVAGQHGHEIGDIDRRITAFFGDLEDLEDDAYDRIEALRISLFERTHSRYTTGDAKEDRQKVEQELKILEQRAASHERWMRHVEDDLDALQTELDKLKKRIGDG